MGAFAELFGVKTIAQAATEPAASAEPTIADLAPAAAEVAAVERAVAPVAAATDVADAETGPDTAPARAGAEVPTAAANETLAALTKLAGERTQTAPTLAAAPTPATASDAAGSAAAAAAAPAKKVLPGVVTPAWLPGSGAEKEHAEAVPTLVAESSGEASGSPVALAPSASEKKKKALLPGVVTPAWLPDSGAEEVEGSEDLVALGPATPGKTVLLGPAPKVGAEPRSLSEASEAGLVATVPGTLRHPRMFKVTPTCVESLMP